MRSTCSFLLVIVFLCLALPSAAQSAAPGGIRLLPGYAHHREQGIDSQVGTIARKGGLAIHYDIGDLAGVYTECGKLCGWTDGELWRRRQVVNGQPVIIVGATERRVIISFPESKANFYATITSEKDMADFLLIVLSYHPR